MSYLKLNPPISISPGTSPRPRWRSSRAFPDFKLDLRGRKPTVLKKRRNAKGWKRMEKRKKDEKKKKRRKSEWKKEEKHVERENRGRKKRRVVRRGKEIITRTGGRKTYQSCFCHNLRITYCQFIACVWVFQWRVCIAESSGGGRLNNDPLLIGDGVIGDAATPSKS